MEKSRNLTLSQIKGLSIIAASEKGTTLYLKNLVIKVHIPKKLAELFVSKKIIAVIKQTDIDFNMMIAKKYVWDKNLVAYVTRDEKSGKIITYISKDLKNKKSKKQKYIKFSRVETGITTEVEPYTKKGEKVALRELHRYSSLNTGQSLRVLL